MVNPEVLESSINVVQTNLIQVDHEGIPYETFTAAPNNCENYFALWARDGAITAISMLHTDDPRMLKAAQDTFELLRLTQMKRGKIAAYIDFSNPEQNKIVYDGWGMIEPLDGQMWYILLARELYLKTQDPKYLSPEYMGSYYRAMDLLDNKGNHEHLLMSWPEFAGWDDQMRRRGQVASLESMRILALKSYAEMLEDAGFHEDALLRRQQAQILTDKMRMIFWLNPQNVEWLASPYSSELGPGYFSSNPDRVIEAVNNTPLPFAQSFLNTADMTHHGIQRFDSWANIWVILAGVADESQRDAIFDYIAENNLESPFPIWTLYPVIKPGDSDWSEFYKTNRNKPYTYHNGPVWPMVSGFYMDVLKAAGLADRYNAALCKISELVMLTDESTGLPTFAEFYDPRSKTGKVGNTANLNQCWSAAALVPHLMGKSILTPLREPLGPVL